MYRQAFRFLKSEALSIPSKAESGISFPILLETKIKIISEFGKQLLHCFVTLIFNYFFLIP